MTIKKANSNIKTYNIIKKQKIKKIKILDKKKNKRNIIML